MNVTGEKMSQAKRVSEVVIRYIMIGASATMKEISFPVNNFGITAYTVPTQIKILDFCFEGQGI